MCAKCFIEFISLIQPGFSQDVNLYKPAPFQTVLFDIITLLHWQQRTATGRSQKQVLCRRQAAFQSSLRAPPSMLRQCQPTRAAELKPIHTAQLTLGQHN